MFLYENKKENTQATSDNNGSMLIGAIALVIAATFQKIWMRWIYFYHHNFEYIWFFVVVALLGLVVWRLFKLKNIHQRLIEKISKIVSLNALARKCGGVFVGHAEHMPLLLPNQLRLEHVQIIGATGRGKTKSVIIPWIEQDFLSNKKIILIDGKGDLGLKDDLIKRLGETEKIIHFNMNDSQRASSTNPLKYGSPQQITDRIFNSFNFEDEYYKGVQYDTCLKITRALVEVDNEVTFKNIYRCLCDDDFLGEVIKHIKSETLKRDLTNYLAKPKKDRDQNHMGLMTQIGPFADGELSHLVSGKIDDVPFMSIADLLLAKTDYQLIIVSLPTLSYQEMGKALGKMLLQELAWAIGERQKGGKDDFVSVFLDEFSSFAYAEFVQVLNKARSAGVAIHLSHQSMGDLWSISKEFGDIVNTNTNVKILLGLNDPTAADYFASHIGTRRTEKITERAKENGLFSKNLEKIGEGSVREVEEYIIHPNTLKSLSPGEGVLFTRTPEGMLATQVEFRKLQNGDV